jgi:flagellar biosynthesis/type III secretory pathway chaperone
MNDTALKSLEELFYQKIMLYNDLLNCFKEERESLVNIDMEKLWAISKEKEELSQRINSTRQEILSLLGLDIDLKSFSAAHIFRTIPDTKKPQFQKLNMAIIKLKDEIGVLRRENMNFIDDSLNFLDEMIAILTGDGKQKETYNVKCRLDKTRHTMLLDREA